MSPDLLPAAAALIGGFLIGGVPFGVLVTRLFGLGDLRKIGSGNIGATNVLRTGNKGAAAATLVLDALKGALPALVAGAVVDPSLAALAAGAAGFGAFLGHCFSPYLGFTGGKGVATGFGALLAWRWEAALICAALWLAVAILTKRSSAGALAATLAAPVAFALLAARDLLGFVIAMAAILIWKHRENIGRLIRGQEPKISLGGSSGGKR